MSQSRFIRHLSSLLVVLFISVSFLQSVSYAAELPQSQSEQLSGNSLPNESIIWNGNTGHPRLVQGKLSSVIYSDSEIFSYLSSNEKLYGFSNPQSDFKILKKDRDHEGKQHYLLQQSYNGIPVYGKYIRTHLDSDNKLYAVTNQSLPELNLSSIDTSPALSVEQATYSLITSIEQSTGQTIILGGSIGPRKLTAPKTDLLLYPVNDQYVLAYHVNVEYLQPSYNQWDGYVDAHTGVIINKFTRIADVSLVGTGLGYNKDTKQINITLESNGTYDLVDTTKAMYQSSSNTGVIATYDYQKPFAGPIFSNYTYFYDGDAVDAHYNAGIVYNYYYNQLHRNSIDDQGMDIVSVVNAGPMDNAFWDGYEMIYGDGLTTFSCLSCALDVVAHELTHGVTQYTAGLGYVGQSGALNESISDIMGVVINNKNWTIGEDTGIITGDRLLRDLETPSKSLTPQPATMANYKVLPFDDANDNGGVHINSGIPNHAAYLIGTGINAISGLEGQGRALLGQITYGAMTSYLTPTSQFVDARDAFVLAAGDLNLTLTQKNAVVEAVKSAWAAVGLPYTNDENNIVYFKTPTMTGDPVINTSAHTVTFQVYYGASLLNITPVINVSPGALITSPSTSQPQNFTNPVTYTVKSQSGKQQTWKVTGTVAPAIVYNDILSFSVDQQTGPSIIDPVHHTVQFYVESNVDVTALTPSIEVTQKATLAPLSGIARNFTSPVIYEVKAQNGSVQNWIVTCIKDSTSPKLDYANSIGNNQIFLHFDKKMNTASLANPLVFHVESLDPSVAGDPTVLSATVDCVYKDRVTLNTTNLKSDNAYKITVAGVSSSIGYSVRPDWNTGFFLVADTAPPVLNTAIISGSQLVLTFDEYIYPYTNYYLSAWLQVKVNGIIVALSIPTVTSRKITVPLNVAVTSKDIVSISYNAQTPANGIKDLHENALPSFSDMPVINRTVAPAVFASNGYFHYAKKVKQIIKHPTLPIVYAIFEGSNEVYSINMQTTQVKTKTMDYQPERLYYAANELYVALVHQPHNYYWWDVDQTGTIAILNADLMTKAAQFDVATDPFDLFVDIGGNINVTSGSGQWPYMHSYNRNTLKEISKVTIRQLSFLQYKSVQNKFYALDTDGTPVLSSINIDNNGHFSENNSIVPYNYSITSLLSLSPDGQYLFNGGGSIFSSTNQRSTDMNYIRTIDAFSDIAFDLPQNKFYTVKENVLKVYNYTTFQIIKQYTLAQNATGLLKGTSTNELLIVYSENGGDSTTVVSAIVTPANSLVFNEQSGLNQVTAETGLPIQSLAADPCVSAGSGGKETGGGGYSGGIPGSLGDLIVFQSSSPTPTPTPTPTPAPAKASPSPKEILGSDSLVIDKKTDGNGKTTTNVKPDTIKLLDAIKSAQVGADQTNHAGSTGNIPTIVIPIKDSSDNANVQIPASLFMEAIGQAPTAVIVIQTNLGSYSLPVQLLSPLIVQGVFEDRVEIGKLKINIAIGKTTDILGSQIKSKMTLEGYKALSDSINFTLSVEAGGQIKEIVDLHGNYVARSITLPSNSSVNAWSALVYDPLKNETSFVPAVAHTENGQTIVEIKSPHNSIYTIVDGAKTFNDIANHWAKTDIEILASKKIILGITEQSFMPEKKITRAEFAAILVRALGLALEQPNSSFNDVLPTDWFAPSVATAVKANLVTGYDKHTFAPNGTITRQEMAVMLARAIKYAGGIPASASSSQQMPAIQNFKDGIEISSWASQDIEQLLNNGIIAGVTQTQFEPGSPVTRAQVATALKRMLQQLKFIN